MTSIQKSTKAKLFRLLIRYVSAEFRSQPCSVLFLQEGIKLRTREDVLRLLQGLNFLVPGCLADLEILHDKVTTLMQLCVAV